MKSIVHCFLIKIVHCFLHKLFPAFYIKLFSIQHYLTNCSLSFLCKLFFVHYLKNCSLFSHKTPLKSCFLNLNAKSKCFFIFEFHNNRIYFSALIKPVSIFIKFSLWTSYLLYIQICLLHSKNMFFALIKIVHVFS